MILNPVKSTKHFELGEGTMRHYITCTSNWCVIIIHDDLIHDLMYCLKFFRRISRVNALHVRLTL